MSNGASGAAVFVATAFSCVATAACAITHRSRCGPWRLVAAARSGLTPLTELRCASCWQRGVKGMDARPEQGATWPLCISKAFMLKYTTRRSEAVGTANRAHHESLMGSARCCMRS